MGVKKGLRRLAACAALAVAGATAAVAAGPGLGAIHLPTVTVPTLPVSTPSVTLPVVPPPPPTPPAPVPVPPAPVPPAPVTLPHLTPPAPPPASQASPPPPSSGTTSGSGSTGAYAPATGSATGTWSTGTSSGSGASGGKAVQAGPKAKPRVHLTKRRPTRTLLFHVRRAGVVRVVLIQVGCGRVASFPVHAHEGTNAITVRRRIDGRRLPDGTYRIRGRSHGHTVLRATLVIGRGGTAPCTLATVTSQIAAVFGTGASSDSTAGTGSSSAAGASGSSGKLAAGKGPTAIAPKPHSGVLGATASKVLPGSGGTQLGLLIVLAAAIFLLTVGALPREAVPHPGTAAFLVRRRATIAVAGLTALGAFLISYFIT